MTYSDFKDNQYGNKFSSLYDLHQDIKKFRTEFNQDVIYWSTYLDYVDRNCWSRVYGWRNTFKYKDAPCYYSWMWKSYKYIENESYLYDKDKYGKDKIDFILSLTNNDNDLHILTKIFNSHEDRIFNLKAFL